MTTSASPAPETISLYLKNETSDKEYHVHLRQVEALWSVEIQYARRGSALRSATKTKDPLPYEDAKELYDKTVRGQLKEGYTPDVSGEAYQNTPDQGNFTGILPHLLNPDDQENFAFYRDSDDWMLQEKFDGQRLLMRKAVETGVTGINRDGLAIAIPVSFEESLAALPCVSCVIDSEWLGDAFAPFDLLELDGVDLRTLPAEARKAALDELLAKAPHACFHHVETATGPAAKQALFNQTKSKIGEGVVGKLRKAPYVPGRPNSKGSQIKLKFVESATMVVTSHHKSKRSVGVSAHSGNGVLKSKGSVTIPANHEIPAIGEIVEILYLYAYEKGSLYQPCYKGIRVDKSLADCLLAQLKHKPEPVSLKGKNGALLAPTFESEPDEALAEEAPALEAAPKAKRKAAP